MAWVFSSLGFFSIVAKGGEGKWMVRARATRHLQNLLNATGIRAEIITSNHTDYAYRIIVDAEQLHTIFREIERSLTYDNVKGMVAKLPGEEKYVAAMHKVWGIMAEALQPGGAYSLGLKNRSRQYSHTDRDGSLLDGKISAPARDADEPSASEVAQGIRGNRRKAKHGDNCPFDA